MGVPSVSLGLRGKEGPSGGPIPPSQPSTLQHPVASSATTDGPNAAPRDNSRAAETRLVRPAVGLSDRRERDES
jgi:hypothetical protein